TGTQNHEGIVGAAAAVDFLASLARTRAGSRRAALAQVFSELHARGRRQLTRLWEGLARIPAVTLYGPPPEASRTPTLAFTVAGRTSDDVATALARRALFLSSGDFYAATAIRRLGHEKDGVVRAGCACYTSEGEIERLIEAVRETVT
ncbi:MAG TPA: aminotransferase class V-fold PLP-dependent enzyme, partial [Thermoanaerobaculia bacterium]|nr:aminotransferase class V-fold PLP-dependent enzyme [Thermoanaerobaculia bacterium]